MGSEVDAEGLQLAVVGFWIRPIQWEDDFLGGADDRRHQVAAGDLEVPSWVA